VEDYPRTLGEFEARFADEEACRRYLMALRWPEGFRCPRCGGSQARRGSRGLLRCSQCDYQASVTAGTIFQDTRLSLTIWFRAIWWVTSQKNGTSALGLQRVLGLGSYRTAWILLHKLRRAMVRSGRERLRGRVEVDETYVGGEEEGARGRQTQDKALVAIAAEEDGSGIGRIRMKRITRASKPQLHTFLEEAVEPGSIVHTDGWESYVGMESLGYRHEYEFIAGSGETASALLPRVHRVASLLKRWLMGTHQGSVSREHLDYYLDEFTFRFNRRRSRHRGKLFYRLVEQAVSIGPRPYGEIVRRSRRGRPQHMG
jgi:transposase-like protein/ribosomal protein L37AE/L43A